MSRSTKTTSNSAISPNLSASMHEFEWQGEYYRIPRTSIRLRPISNPEGSRSGICFYHGSDSRIIDLDQSR
jgi:hypothetical protein